ncbi:histidine kinase dimerization/phospho-acceptor domain-containing protein [Bacteriovorax sp. DB6_IX]|uniref:histidine kinase dimerization/phospho-acceptor domain-containing protein n=1 Tax=Bacteriovorax sp. DB6_IX TaxID=1353530 RepID=UPI000389F530|nr:histidine kinase dimerization/phospho-acceptor domain-containing protein [Bacteriovorax sp. DB6_IX]EQC52376.1 histidine kinase A domain protein [Bacteriovorax sp. DB6_IX]
MKKTLLDKDQEQLINAFSKYQDNEVHDLMGSVSHDIKNPLGIIELSLGLLEDKVEKLLEGEDEKVQAKIQNFFNNIGVGLERCQEILDAALDIKRNDIEASPGAIEDLKFFCDQYYIFSKPKLKRKKINFENTIVEGTCLNTIPQEFAKLFIETINFCTYNVDAPEGAMLELSFDSKLIFKLTPKNESTLDIVKPENDLYEVFSYRLEKLKEKLGAEIEMTKEGQDIIVSLALKS